MKLKLSRKFLIAVLLVFTALIYINTLQNGFVYDDHGVVEGNRWITEFKYLPKILTSSIWGYEAGEAKSSEYFRPMTQIAYMIEYHIFGFKPWGWHLVNGLLHMLNALMVFIVGRSLFITFASPPRLNGDLSEAAGHDKIEKSALTAAFIASIIFAAHPVNVEPVAWVACIGELMYMLFAMTAFYIYMRLYPAGDGADSGKTGTRVWLYLLSLLCYLLAALSKETGLTLPAVLIVYDYMRRKSIKNLPFKNYLPFLLVAVGYILMRSYALKGVSPREAYLEHPVLQALNFFPVMLKFLWKLLLPINLTPAYIYEPILSVADPLMLVSIVVIIMLGYLLWRYRFFRPWLPVAAVILFVPLTPTFLLLFRDHLIYHIAIPSDRFLYMPSAGVALIFGFFIARQIDGGGVKCFWGKLSAVVFIAITLLFAYGTVQRNTVWKSDTTLWRATLEGDPDNYFAHFVMAELHMNDGRALQAVSELNEVERLRPGYPAVRHRRGMMYFAIGEVEAAEADFKAVLQDDPLNSDAHYNLAMIYLGRGGGEYTQSLTAFVRALETVKSGFMKIKILNGMAVAYTALGDYEAALGAVEGVLEIDPSNTKAHKNLSALKRFIK